MAFVIARSMPEASAWLGTCYHYDMVRPEDDIWRHKMAVREVVVGAAGSRS
jgi:hypothetical protein